MNLYCWAHNTVHEFTPDDVEQIVYALTAWAYDSEAGTDEHVDSKRMACPKTMLHMASESEAYLEHVEQGVECRKALVP